MSRYLFLFFFLCSYQGFAENTTEKNEAEEYSDSEYDFDDEFDEELLENEPTRSDPLQWLNRPIYVFNDKLYSWIYRPIGKGYRKVCPRIVRNRFRDFFSNLKSPSNIVNSLLQAEFRKASRATGRFLINSTVGVGGLYDAAWRMANSAVRLDIRRQCHLGL